MTSTPEHPAERPQGAPPAAEPRRVGLLSVHTSPLAQPGTGDSGGMNVSIVCLARQLAACGVEVEIFTRAGGSDLPPTVSTEPGLRVHHIAAGPPALSKSDLASHLCAFYLGLAAHPTVPELDLLHGHYWMSGWVGRQANRRLGLPLVQSFHTLGRVKNASLAPGDVPEPVLRLAAEDRVVADADAIIAPTGAERALLADRYGAPPGRVRVVTPGVDLGVFSASGDRAAARRSLGDGRIVLFVGRLQPLKGPDIAVRALAALDAFLPDDGVPTRLVVVGGPSGDGRGRTDPFALRRLAAELGIADRVALLAPRPQAELALLYRAADAVLMPSRSESFGLVALEAQACGTPVVGSAVSGLAEAIGGEGGGTLVQGDDPLDFARALVPYLTDPRIRAAAGEAGRRKAARYSWRRTAAATLAVYRDVLARAGREQRAATGA
ncbi:MAG TPA: glycosyltransferase [Egibacteraceae bacterium]|nr:glycosyltransferase [Egibacteraceae bacterium]